MLSIIAAFSLIAIVNADTVVPVQSSQVDVRQSGGEFSYNIQENRGVAAISDSVPIIAPLVKTIPVDTKSEGSEHAKEGHGEPAHHEQKPEARAHIDTKELKKPTDTTIIAQPFIAPLEYIPIYTHPGYTIPALPKASMFAPISAIPAIPYPYTLIRTV